MTKTGGPTGRFGWPVWVGAGCALLGMLLALVGIVKGAVPARPLSILLALFISGGVWGVVAWAVATAVHDVESDLESDGSDG